MTEQQIRIGHLENIAVPWAAAGGVTKTIEDIERMAITKVGWIEDGSHTLMPRLGNAYDPAYPERGPVFKTYIHEKATGETTNSMGMRNIGLDALESQIGERVAIARTHGKPYILNLAPISEDPASEAIELVSRGYGAGADAVLLNTSCPNVITPDGGRHELLSRSPADLARVLGALTAVTERYQKVFLRVSPQGSFAEARAIYEVIRRSGVVGAVFTPNTWPGFRPVDSKGSPLLEVAGGLGGRSGPATADASTEQTRWAVELLHGSGIDVVSSSGITTGYELRRRLAVGAVAGAGTTVYYESDDWQAVTAGVVDEYQNLNN